MSKAKRLNEMILLVNRMKKFTVRELAQEFGVSKRTIIRDLQELSELGVPLYSEVGPHGGYQVLNERILPPIAFSEEEAVSIFFALHALRNYISHPFNTEYESIKRKFYLNLSGDIRDTIDKMKNRVDFVSEIQHEEIPILKDLLKAAIQQNVIIIGYVKNGINSNRRIQPIGIYAKSGKWYCPSYCFLQKDYRVFRCDHIKFAEIDPHTCPIDLSNINLENRFTAMKNSEEGLALLVDLTEKGVEKIQFTNWPNIIVNKRCDNSGFATGMITKSDLDFFAEYFITYGNDALIKSPPELIDCIKEKLEKILHQYEKRNMLS